MTTLYKPVLIESAEQAEALPEGTIATCAEDWPVEKDGGLWGRQGWSSSFLADTGGWTALLPVEAEEESKAERMNRVGDPRWQESTRLVTPWEEE